jgi:hypothetical protein
MKNLMPVYNEIARIPLIVHLPGDRQAGSRVTALTQTTDLMPTFLDYFGAPVPPHPHGTSMRPALEGNAAVHDSIVYGYFGMALNATDGQYTYFRNPIEPESTVYAYTSMPTQFHSFIPREELAQAQMGRFLSHTYNVPLYKVPQKGRPPLRARKDVDRADALNTAPPAPGGFLPPALPREGYDPQHELFDLVTDLGQERPLANAALEGRFVELMRAQLTRLAAPDEQYVRLGLR